MLVAVNSPTSIHQGLDVNDKNIYEFIQGYAGIKSCGVNTNKTVVGSDGKTYYTHGYVELEDVTLSEIYGGKIKVQAKQQHNSFDL